LGVLAGHVPPDLVDQVLADTGRVQRRLRRLPARAVVWFVLALALFQGQGYRSVWRELAHCEADDAATPSTPGLSQARRRVGAAPLGALFARLRGPAGRAWRGGRISGRAAAGVLGRDHARRAGQSRQPGRVHRLPQHPWPGRVPKVRLLQLIECGTHAVIDAAFGAVSEQVLARRVLGSLGKGMLLLGDRNFPSYQLWRQAAGTGAHLL
jgi:hypothetical protein